MTKFLRQRETGRVFNHSPQLLVRGDMDEFSCEGKPPATIPDLVEFLVAQKATARPSGTLKLGNVKKG